MTEYSPAVEVPKTKEDRRGSVIGRAARENYSKVFSEESTRRIAGGLAIFGALTTAAQLEHWFDHSGALLEFMQGSGRHFLVGYMGAMAGIAKSKAETVKSKFAAGLAGAMAADVLAEAGQSIVLTGGLHHGSVHDVLSFASKKEIFWGNAKDALAAEVAAVGGIIQVIARRRAAQPEIFQTASEAL